MTDKIENSPTANEKWFWHFVGLKHDIDVTQDDFYAINADTGEDSSVPVLVIRLYPIK